MNAKDNRFYRDPEKPDDSRIVRAPDEPPLKKEYTQDEVLDITTLITDRVEADTGRCITESEHCHLCIDISDWLQRCLKITVI